MARLSRSVFFSKMELLKRTTVLYTTHNGTHMAAQVVTQITIEGVVLVKTEEKKRKKGGKAHEIRMVGEWMRPSVHKE